MLARVEGKLREARLLRFVGHDTRDRALIQFDDGSQQLVESYVLEPAPEEPEKRERFWWPESQSGRRWLVGLIIAALGVIGTFLGVFLSSRSKDTTSSPTNAAAQPQALTTTAAYDLDASMVAYNTAYGRRWGRSIAIDNNDPLVFRLRITNQDDNPTPDTHLDFFYTNGDPTAVVVGFHPGGDTAATRGSHRRWR